MLDVVGDDVARRSESVRFRRALALIGMTLVLPGSAQLVAGNKAVGRAAVRIAASLALIAVGTVLVLGREAVLDLGLDPLALLAAQIVAVVLALCWLGLFLDAWRLGRPPALRRSQRLLSAGLSLSLMAGVAAPLFYGAHLLSVQRSLIGDLFADGDIGELYKGRLNVLLLGGDAGQDRVGVRTDTIVLASVDVANGRTVLFSLPRNLEGATFPPDTPAATEFPDGFPDFLYGVYTYGAEHPTMFAPAENPGAKAIQQAVAQTLGVPVHYYMLANLNGFRSLVNSLGGVTIRVQQRLPIGGGTKLDGTENPITGYIDPGLQKLNGYKALWYARSRASTSDYDRMNRQRCLLGGLLREADPVNVLRNYGDIAASTKSLLRTDMTRGALKALVDISDKVRAAGVDTLTFAPPRFDPADPDIKAVRARVQKAIKRSEDGGQDASTDAGGQGGGGKGGSNSGGGGQGGNSSGGGGGQGAAGQGRDGGGGQGGNSSGGGGGQGGAGQGGNGATDLSDVCRYA